MKVVQIQSNQNGAKGLDLTSQPKIHQFAFKNAQKSDSVQISKNEMNSEDLRNKQLALKSQIDLILETETDSKKIKQLTNYQKILDVLLENGKNSVGNTTKKTPAVGFGNAAQKAEAQGIVHAFSLTSAGIAAAMAQMPGFDEAALAANDIAMAIAICKTYGLTLKKSIATTIIAPIMGNAMGVKLFSKALTWFPGAGNALNAAVAGSVTEFIGHSIVGKCESGEMQAKIKKLIEKEGQ